MLDNDMTKLYSVEVKRLNEQVKRNIKRFPESFRFQLTDSEMEILISQIVMSNEDRILKSQFATSSWGGRRTKPYVFTEQGIAMLSAVFKSETAVKVRNRFAIIDNTTVYHFGASLKDLGKKWFRVLKDGYRGV